MIVLLFYVRYRGVLHQFDTGVLKKSISDRLKNRKIGLIVKKARADIPKDTYQQFYFNSSAPLNQLTILFDPPLQIR